MMEHHSTLQAGLVAQHDAGGPVAPAWRETGADRIGERTVEDKVWPRNLDAFPASLRYLIRRYTGSHGRDYSV